MKREVIRTDGAPRAIGPYAQAIRQGGLLFCSGQIGMDPATGELVPGGVEAQAERALANLGAVLAAAGSSWDRVLKTTLYLARMEDFAVVNGIYGRHVGEPPPARATVAAAGLPKGALFEVEAIAACDRTD